MSRYAHAALAATRGTGVWHLSTGAVSVAVTAVSILCLVIVLQPVQAETPFKIEDPATIAAGRWESFTSYERQVDSQGGTTSVPQVELHSGLRENLLLHVDIPYQTVQGVDSRATGIGDLGFALKYRFLHGKGDGFTAAIFPHTTVPTGNSRIGLGSGKPTYELPLWVQHTAAGTTICVGGGYSFNPVPGGRTSTFAGLLAHRDITSALLLGAEILAKGAVFVDDRAATAVDIGGIYRATPNVGVFLRVGRTISGRRTDNVFVGLYRAWGPAPAAEGGK